MSNCSNFVHCYYHTKQCLFLDTLAKLGVKLLGKIRHLTVTFSFVSLITNEPEKQTGLCVLFFQPHWQ